jgi:hypothetical protein
VQYNEPGLLYSRLRAVLYCVQMAQQRESVFDKAEELARRVLGWLGSKVERKAASDRDDPSLLGHADALLLQIEALIESCLRPDLDALLRVAPNRFTVSLTHEESSRLGQQYLEALAAEIGGGVREYINNRRYETQGSIQVEVRSDVFARSTSIKAAFDPDEAKEPDVASRTICLSAGGQQWRLHLRAEGPPACVGRAAGNAVRIEDESVSRVHCSIALRANGEVVIADLGSSNGTLVNGQPLKSNEARPLAQGDVISVGDLILDVVDVAL